MSVVDSEAEESVLFPLRPEEMSGIVELLDGVSELSEATYEDILESQCGASDDSQPVELYDGTLGVTTDFVDAHQRPVGQLHWNSNLADIYDNPGNVNDVRWCTGALITESLFLSAGHCFDQNPPNGWVVPRIDGTNNPIPSAEIARNMHINFNYQVDPNGDLRAEEEFAVVDLVEYRLGGLDVAVIRLAGNPGSIFGLGKVATSDPDTGDMACIIGHPAGVPKRIEAGPVTSFSGDRIRYNDIDTLGGNSGSPIWHSPSGEIVGVHTNGGCNQNGTGSNSGFRISSIREESVTVREVDNFPMVIQPGTHTIQQKSNGRFLDAHESSPNDFSVVTRGAQNNDTQRWDFAPVATVYTMRQVSSGRFVDAHETGANDFSVVTRTHQGNDTQRWVFSPVEGELSTYTIQQLRNSRFMDAHEGGNDHSVVTRTAQRNDTQRWLLSELDDGTFTLRQRSSGRFMDAHQGTNDNSVVTRGAQNNDTQRWIVTPVGAVYTVQQKSSGRFLDAHQSSANDFSVVTRTAQNNDTQRWVLLYQGDSTYTVQQLSEARFMDAHQGTNDNSVVTRTAQNNDTQRWVIKRA